MGILHIPPGAKTLEMINSVIWIEGGILYSAPKPGDYVVADRALMQLEAEKMKAFIGNKKVMMIAEAHPKAESPRKEDQDFIANELTGMIKALAIVTPNALSRMVANLFFLFKPAPYPVKMFVSESDARKWLESIPKKGPGIPVI